MKFLNKNEISIEKTLGMITFCLLFSGLHQNIHAQRSESEYQSTSSSQKNASVYSQGRYFIGTGALFNNYLTNSEEIFGFNLNGQTGFFYRKNVVFGTDLKLRMNYLKASKKFDKSATLIESTWFTRFCIGDFFPQISLTFWNSASFRSGIGAGYHYKLSDNVIIAPIFVRNSRAFFRNAGPVRNILDQPVPSSEFQISLIYLPSR